MKKLLLIEDDVYIVDIYKKVLTEGGFEVDVALDGEDGLKKANENDYRIILLDIMLPKVDGIQVLKQMREGSGKSANTPIFMLTNLGQDGMIANAFSLGANGYMIKAQVKPQNILEQINEFLKDNEKQQTA